METYFEMMNNRRACRIVGATPRPCKVKKKTKQIQLRMQDPDLANLNQTTTSKNRRTNEEEAPTVPVSNVCNFNDDEIDFKAQNKYETYNAYSIGGGQQYCPNSLQHCMENFEKKCTPRSLFR